MASALKKKEYKLDLKEVLAAIDRNDKKYYSKLTPEEQKAYSPFVLLRFMSSLGDQSPNIKWAILATNDLVNLGFWSLSSHPELQHLLFCVTGLGRNQYRPWIAPNSKKNKNKKIIEFWENLYPGINDDEIDILNLEYTVEEFKEFAIDSGVDKSEIKDLIDGFKKMVKPDGK